MNWGGVLVSQNSIREELLSFFWITFIHNILLLIKIMYGNDLNTAYLCRYQLNEPSNLFKWLVKVNPLIIPEHSFI